MSHEWILSFKSRNNESQLSQTRILFSILTVGQLLPNLIDKTIGTVSQWQRGGFRRFIAELMRFVARFADHGAGNQRRPPERVVASNIFLLALFLWLHSCPVETLHGHSPPQRIARSCT